MNLHLSNTRNVSSRHLILDSVDDTVNSWHGGELVAVDNAGEFEYVHTDHLGSPAASADSDGDLVSSTSYFPFGDVRAPSGAFGTERGFTGQIADAGTGLNFFFV